MTSSTKFRTIEVFGSPLEYHQSADDFVFFTGRPKRFRSTESGVFLFFFAFSFYFSFLFFSLSFFFPFFSVFALTTTESSGWRNRRRLSLIFSFSFSWPVEKHAIAINSTPPADQLPRRAARRGGANWRRPTKSN